MSKDISIEILKYIDFDNGVYIEAGANDGKFQSLSYTLEKEKGWSGLLVEPSPAAYNECLKNRDQEKNVIIHGALVSDNYGKDTIVGDFYGHPMNSVGGNRLNNQANSVVEVPAYTITQLLVYFEFNHIDLFALDTEGYEMEILRGLNFDLYKPRFFVIEWNEGEDELFPFMESKGYENLGNISDFNLIDDPLWPGCHQDWLFKLKEKDNA